MAVRAIWNDTELAASEATVVVEGNHYFPAADVVSAYLRPSETHTVCAWKGTASYYDVVVGEAANADAAWYYPTPSDAAKEITDHIAFWKGVEVIDDAAS